MAVVRYARTLVMLLTGLISLAADAGTISSFTYSAHSFGGSRQRTYKVYVPSGLTTPAPMVMALHGCQQTEQDVLNDWGLTKAADARGFILVTPFITSWSGMRNTNCWGFWFPAERREGAGEVEDIHQIALEVEAKFSIDPARRYITGLSSGAAMTVDAAIAHNEYWSAAASASGLPYGEDSASVSLSGQCPGSATFHGVSRIADDMRAALNDKYPIPLMVLQNNDDCTVVQPAGRNLRDAHLKVFGSAGHDTASTTLAIESDCTPVFQSSYGCRHSRYTADKNPASRSIVETVFFNGPRATANTSDTDHGHYWVGGENGTEGKWAVRRGPSYPDIILDFFSRHPRTTAPQSGVPRITLKGDNPLKLTLGTTFTDPGATASDPEDGTLTVSADCSSVNTSRAGEYSCSYKATDRDGHAASASRSIVVTDPNQPTLSCKKVTDGLYSHVTAGRARLGGYFGLYAISTGDNRELGFAYNFYASATLTEGEPSKWYLVPPAACSGR